MLCQLVVNCQFDFTGAIHNRNVSAGNRNYTPRALIVCFCVSQTLRQVQHAVAFVSQSYQLTHPSHLSEVVTRPVTGVRDVHPFGFVVLCCLESPWFFSVVGDFVCRCSFLWSETLVFGGSSLLWLETPCVCGAEDAYFVRSGVNRRRLSSWFRLSVS